MVSFSSSPASPAEFGSQSESGSKHEPTQGLFCWREEQENSSHVFLFRLSGVSEAFWCFPQRSHFYEPFCPLFPDSKSVMFLNLMLKWDKIRNVKVFFFPVLPQRTRVWRSSPNTCLTPSPVWRSSQTQTIFRSLFRKFPSSRLCWMTGMFSSWF